MRTTDPPPDFGIVQVKGNIGGAGQTQRIENIRKEFQMAEPCRVSWKTRAASPSWRSLAGRGMRGPKRCSCILDSC
jgi:hypothetical protein